jgi:tetratricopeptide (TPR) repeat protein
MRQFRRGGELNPRDAYVRERMGAVLLWQGKTDEAIQEFRTAVELSDRQPEKLAWLGYALAVRGDSQEARAVLDEILGNSHQQYTSPFYVAMLYTGLGDKDRAFSWLEKAYTARDEWMVYLKIYPEFASLHSDGRFQHLVLLVGRP